MNSEATVKKYERAKTLPRYGSLRTIQDLCGGNRDVLDVGCSSGYLGKLLMEQRNSVYGIDGNQQAVEEAGMFYREVLHLDLNNLSNQVLFDRKKFDVIIFADVLEHLTNPESVLNYFKSLLKPEGEIIVSLPNVALWRVRFDLLFGRFNYRDYGVLDRTHLHLYTFKTAEELLKKCRYRVISSQSAMNLNIFGVLVRVFPFLKSWFGIHIILKAKVDEISR